MIPSQRISVHAHRRIALSRARVGFTLMEVMLTLAVIVMIATVSWPIFARTFDNYRLRKAADTLRTAWANARLQAMTSGQTYVFRFDFNAAKFVVAVWDTGDSQTEAAAETPVAERAGTLPDGTVFHASEKVVDTRTAQIEGAGGQTAPQIFFYADGTTSTAQVLIANANDRFLKVQLRGLTGVAKVGDVVSSDELVKTENK